MPTSCNAQDSFHPPSPQKRMIKPKVAILLKLKNPVLAWLSTSLALFQFQNVKTIDIYVGIT